MNRDQLRGLVLRSLNRFWGARDIPAFHPERSIWNRRHLRERYTERFELGLCDHTDTWYRSEYLQLCENCERCVRECSEVSTYTRPNRISCQYWCLSCAEDESSCCEDCGDRYADSALEPNDGVVLCRECSEARETESPDEEAFLPSYHNGHRPPPPSRKSPAYSIELELETAQRDAFIAKLQSLRQGGLEIGWERDGSLNESKGIEVLVSCYPNLKTLGDAVGEVLQASRGLQCMSWDTGRCGLHLNSNRWNTKPKARWNDGSGPSPSQGWTSAKVGRLLYLVRGCWRELVSIAGRESQNWAALPQGWDGKPLKLSKWANGEGGKYCAVRVGEDRLEWRLFRGTLSPSRIALYLSAVSTLEGIALGDVPAGQIKEQCRRLLTRLWCNQTLAKEQGKDSVGAGFTVLESVKAGGLL